MKPTTLVLLFVLAAQTLHANSCRVLDISRSKGEFGFTGETAPEMVDLRGVAPINQKFAIGHIFLKQGKPSAEIKVKLNAMDTGMTLRNKHMRNKYLDTEKFPNAEFVLKEWRGPDLSRRGGAGEFKNVPFRGDLTIKGVTKEVSGVSNLTLEGSRLNLSAMMPVRLKDFNVPIPGFMGVSVKNEIKVFFQVEGGVTNAPSCPQ